MENEPMAWQVIIMIISALGIVLLSIIQITLKTTNKRLTQIEDSIQEFVTFKAVQTKVNEIINGQITQIDKKIDKHEDILQLHGKKIDEHTGKIYDLEEHLKLSASQPIKKQSIRRKIEKDIK